MARATAGCQHTFRQQPKSVRGGQLGWQSFYPAGGRQLYPSAGETGALLPEKRLNSARAKYSRSATLRLAGSRLADACGCLPWEIPTEIVRHMYRSTGNRIIQPAHNSSLVQAKKDTARRAYRLAGQICADKRPAASPQAMPGYRPPLFRLPCCLGVEAAIILCGDRIRLQCFQAEHARVLCARF